MKKERESVPLPRKDRIIFLILGLFLFVSVVGITTALYISHMRNKRIDRIDKDIDEISSNYRLCYSFLDDASDVKAHNAHIIERDNLSRKINHGKVVVGGSTDSHTKYMLTMRYEYRERLKSCKRHLSKTDRKRFTLKLASLQQETVHVK